MPIELKYLVWSVALFFVMILAQSITAIFFSKATNAELVGPRDDLPAGGLTPFHGRTKRAQYNMIESMCMFVPLSLGRRCHGQLTPISRRLAQLCFSGDVSCSRPVIGLASLGCARWCGLFPSPVFL